MENKKQSPPDFSGWNATPKIKAFCDAETGKLVSPDDENSADILWWGFIYFYEYPQNEEICGVELEGLGKIILIKFWGFKGEATKACAVFINNHWHVLDDKHGESFDVESNEENGKIVSMELTAFRADKTIIGKTVVCA